MLVGVVVWLGCAVVCARATYGVRKLVYVLGLLPFSFLAVFAPTAGRSIALLALWLLGLPLVMAAVESRRRIDRELSAVGHHPIDSDGLAERHPVKERPILGGFGGGRWGGGSGGSFSGGGGSFGGGGASGGW